MQRLEVSGVVRLIYRSLGVKGLMLSVYCSFCTMPMDSVVFNVSLEISNFQKVN